MDPGSVTPSLPAELYVSLFEQAADAMFLADSEGRVVAVNPRSCDLLGFTADEMIGRQFTDFADPDELRENPGRIDELRAGRSVVSERRLLGKDGRLVSAETTMRILPDGHLLGVARDITERKRAEEALGTANARLEALWSVSSLSEASPKEVADHILGSIVRMTRSPYGFYGFINADESVMTIHAWSGEAMQDCSLVDKPVEFLIRDAGVWGEAVRRRTPLVINDYAAAHDGKKGLPAGHVPLTRLLAVPFFSHGRITAVAAVANRPTDYSQEDVVQMTSFLGSVETITARVRAEEARRRSETLLNVTQRLAGLGGWEWDLETQTMAWTAETYRLHGVEPGEIAPGATGHIELSAECYPPEARSAVLEAFHRCVEQGTPYDLEVPFVDLKGRRMWVRTRAEAVRRGDRIVKVIGDIMDVTGRRGAEEAAAASHQRLLTVLDASANGIYVADPETYEVLFANRALEEIFGSPGQRRCYEYLQHRDSPCPFCTNDRIFGENYGKILRWEFRNEATGRWFECVDRAITWPDGRVVRYEMAIDIHERKLAEEALRASEARLAESNQLLSGVLQHTHMMAVFLDARFNFVWVNRAYADTCRQEPGFFPGRNHFDLFPDAENQAIFQRAVDTGEPCTVAAKPFEFPDQPERGVTYWDWSLVPVKDEGGMVAGLVFTLVEVTEQVRATEALREGEERYRTLVEQASDGVVVADAEGRCLSANHAFAEMLGYSGEELARLRLQDLGAGEAPLEGPGWTGGTPGASASLREWRLAHKDGPSVSVEANVRTLADGRQLAIVRDITTRKLVEEMTGAESLPYGVVITSTDFRFTRVNRFFCELLGYAPEELIGKSVGEVTRPDSQDSTREHLEKVRRREIEHFVVEKCYITRSGGTVHALTFVRGLYASGGGFLGTAASIVDISERVQAESALRESERRFSNVLESMSLIGVILDTEGRITFCNDYLLNLTGWTRDEVLGQSWFERFVPPDIRDEIQNEVFLRNVVAGEVPVHFENEIVTRRDERRLVAWNNIILRDPAGQVTGTASVGEDITERRRAEESRLEMERRLLHSQKLESLGVLAGGIAHDFNNLLMAILGNLELGLRDLSPASPTRPRLDAASHAARRAADLTRQMLAYSGRGKFLIGRVDLNELVEENVHLLRTSIPRTVTLNLNLDRALPAVEADAGQFQQVIMNLITNAAEAIGGEPGVVTLSTGVRDCDGSYLGRSCLDERPPAGRYVYVEVTDTGCGMDEETQKRMFEPFFTTKFTGRGLGLPAVFGIVRGHGGAILLDSAVGRGTTIRVLFPASGGAPVAAETAPAAVVEAAPGAGRGTILIVDDEEMVLQPCAAMVEYMGFTVLTAADGEEAVEMVRRHGASIRAIILDLTMPKLDGAAALERILLIEPGAQVILSSGYDEAEATGRVAKGQLAGFIRKPYYLEQLRTTLERVLGTAL